MNISEAAHRSGLTVKTVRYYANIDMIVPARHPSTGYRAYADSDIAKLQLVGTARKFDFSVDECRELLALFEDKNRPSREVKQITLKKIAEIDKKLSELAALKNQLSHLASSCDGDNRSNCPILNAFSAGGKDLT